MKTETMEEVDVRDKILKRLEEDERSIRWLSTKSDINYSTLYSILVQKVIKLNKDRKRRIGEALQTVFE